MACLNSRGPALAEWTVAWMVQFRALSRCSQAPSLKVVTLVSGSHSGADPAEPHCIITGLTFRPPGF